MYYDLQSEQILFDNVSKTRVKPDRVDIKKRWNSLETENDIHLLDKVRLNSAIFEDEFGVGFIWDHIRCSLSHTCLEIPFSFKHRQFW